MPPLVGRWWVVVVVNTVNIVIVWWMLETSVCTKLLIFIKDKSNMNINIILFIIFSFKTSFGFRPDHLWN